MSKPVRLQLSRQKGFRLQECSLTVNGLPAVKVDRTTRWGNPFSWHEWMENAPKNDLWYREERVLWSKEQAVEEFRSAIIFREIVLDMEPLRGKNLACWCHRHAPRYSCHADVLLELANLPAREGVGL